MANARKPRATKVDRGYNGDSAFPTVLRGLLEQTNTTQEKLAESLGIARQSVAQWKDGKTMPDIYYLDKMADYFNVTTDFLLGRAGNKTVENEEIRQRLGLSDEAIQTLRKLVFLRSMNPLHGNNLEVINGLLRNKKFMEEVVPEIISYEMGEYFYKKLAEEYAPYKEFLDGLSERTYEFEFRDNGEYVMKDADEEAKRQTGIELRGQLELKREALLGRQYRILRSFMDIVERKHD